MGSGPPLSLPLSAFDLQNCEVIEKEGLKNYLGSFMTRPGLVLHLFCPHSFGENTVDGANLTASKAEKSHYLVEEDSA